MMKSHLYKIDFSWTVYGEIIKEIVALNAFHSDGGRNPFFRRVSLGLVEELSVT